MAVDKETIETLRKWSTTAIVIVIVPISGLWMGYNKLQILQEVRSQYVEQRAYAADRAELKAAVDGLIVKADAILQRQAVQEEHQKSTQEQLLEIKARVDRIKP